MTAPDFTAAVAGYLVAQVGSLVSGRVFRPELPQTENASMPRACIVIAPAGGYTRFGAATIPLGDPRVDIRCFGETQLEAQNIAREVIQALKSLQRATYEHTVLKSAQPSGMIPFVGPKTQWPAAVVPAVILHSEIAVP